MESEDYITERSGGDRVCADETWRRGDVDRKKTHRHNDIIAEKNQSL